MTHPKEKLTQQELIREINSRQYSQPFRMACLEAGQSPYEYITDMIVQSLSPIESESVKRMDNHLDLPREMTQQELVDKLETLGQKHYDKLSNPKHREWVNTIRPQWGPGKKKMTPEARDYAMTVLGVLENYDRREGAM